MSVAGDKPAFEIERGEESHGHCDCCGRTSHCVSGYIYEVDGPPVAIYLVRWTDGHLDELGADFDLVLGTWGEGTSAADRLAVSLHYLPKEGSPGSFMVVDGRPVSDLASGTLNRDDVIGTPLAPQVFALVDAICEQDGRFL